MVAPRELEVADLNGDGLADIIVVDNSGDNLPRVIAWMPCVGAGEFGDQRALQLTESLSVRQVSALHIVDLDGDGDLDILVGFRSSGNYQQRTGWFQNDGEGNFTAEIVISTEFRMQLAGDVDGDGDVDIVATYDDNSDGIIDGVAIVTNDGDGTFASIVQIEATQYRPMKLIDMDLDGDLDIIVFVSQSIIIMHNNAGLFGAETVVTSNVTFSYDGSDPLPVNAFDIDSDGDVDIMAVVNSPWPSGLVKFTNNGDSWGPQTQIITSGYCYVDHADIDGDGIEDIFFSQFQGNLVAWRRNSGGNFLSGATLTNMAMSASGVRAADLDQDGDLDILSASPADYRVSWYRNEGNGIFGSMRILTPRPTISFDGTRTDWDGDSDLDIVHIGSYSLLTVENLGNGEYAPAQQIAFLTSGKSVSSADFNGDGLADLTIADDDVLYWFPNLGGGLWGERIQLSPQLNTNRYWVEATDVDNDGDMDIMYTDWNSGTDKEVGWFQNDGTGNFESATVIPNLSNINYDAELNLYDFNNDGLLDILSLGSSIEIFLNTGGATYSPSISPISGSLSLCAALDVVDMDSDGDLDLITSTTSGTSRYTLNNGDGTFGSVINLPGIQHRFLADLTGDGILDLLEWGNPPSLRVGDGPASWAAPIALAGNISVRYSDHFDMDGDGDDDIVSTGFLGWYENFFYSPYSVSGSVFVDSDGNGIQGDDELGASWVQVTTTPDTYGTFPDSTGAFSINTNAGQYTVAPQWSAPFWTISTGQPSYDVVLSPTSPSSTGNNFGIMAAVDTSLILPSITISPAPCGGPTTIWLSYANQGTRVEAGTLSFELDQRYTYVQSEPEPTSVNGNVISWEFDTLSYFDIGFIEIEVIVPSAMYMGDTLLNRLVVNTVNDEGDILSTFEEIHTSVLLCAFDPNEKQVQPQGYGEGGSIAVGSEYLEYTIHFQNTGSATAQDVMLRDELSLNVDRSSLQILGYSHVPSLIHIESDGEFVVRFNNIQLPDSGSNFAESQGFVHFRVRLVPGLPHLSEVPNTAGIYFDYNEAVITNTTLTTLVDCSLWQPVISTPAVDVLEAPEGDQYQWFWNDVVLPSETARWLAVDMVGLYSVQVTSEYGCTSTSDPVALIALGINEHVNNSLVIIPNPFSAEARLLFSETLTSEYRVELIDIHGRVIRQLQGKGSRDLAIRRENLSAGIYMVRLTASGRVVGTTRAVIE